VHECEFWSDEFDHDVVFASLEDFDCYLAKRFPRTVRKKPRQRASSLKR